MSDNHTHNIFIISDGTGETADQLMKAALVQYVKDNTKLIRYKNIRSESQVASIFEEAHQLKGIVVYTMVTDSLRQFIKKISEQTGVPSVDLLGPLLEMLEQHLQRQSKSEPGIFHQVDANYFKRIEAIEFTVKHDDGKYTDNLEKADIILVGLSRTSKTPLSIYLSYKGWKVANVPIVKDIALPPMLFTTDQRKVIGLIIQPEALSQIRKERLLKMGDNPGKEYADLDAINLEIDYCREIYRKNRRWPVFDVTGKALEETASEVEKYIRASIPEKFIG